MVTACRFRSLLVETLIRLHAARARVPVNLARFNNRDDDDENKNRDYVNRDPSCYCVSFFKTVKLIRKITE